ncbi:MAG: orotate phosphoribosyltransferase [Bacteroidota bacterium]
MVLDRKSAKKTAELLLQINAIKLSPESPFTWASGWKSPIYCDNRIMLSYPTVRSLISQKMAKQVTASFGTPDAIAGVATGAIGIGILVANLLDLPFVYVRPQPKSHGRKNQIEGFLEAGQRVVVIEDLISTGTSSLNAVKALQEAQADVMGMLAIFTYGLATATENFEKAGISLLTLSDYPHLIEQAVETDQITKAQLQTLMEWKRIPEQWPQ